MHPLTKRAAPRSDGVNHPDGNWAIILRGCDRADMIDANPRLRRPKDDHKLRNNAVCEMFRGYSGFLRGAPRSAPACVPATTFAGLWRRFGGSWPVITCSNALAGTVGVLAMLDDRIIQSTTIGFVLRHVGNAPCTH